MATIGAVPNSDHQLLISVKQVGQDGLVEDPRTRPVAMNPVDHPMGGGEGRASGGHPRSKMVFLPKDTELALGLNRVINSS